VQIRLGRLLPPEKALVEAISDDAKTKRLCRIILYSAIPGVVVAALVVVAAVYFR
jgi:hypothetical protein